MSLYFGVIGNRDYIKYRGRRLPFWEFLDHQPDGWLCSLAYRRGDVPDHTTRIWDCGAWSYRDMDIPSLNGAVVTPAWAWEQYLKLARPGDFVVAPDHMLIPGVDVAFRRGYNRSSACDFLRLTQEMPCLRPMAVVHGMNVPERVRTALELHEIGYRALALGGLAGMAGQKPNSVIAAVQEVRAAIPGVYLHVLGVSSPSFAAEWNHLGVDSFDGASCFKQAFTAGAFYLERDGSLVAYRAARPGEDVAAIPPCDCRACRLLREGWRGYTAVRQQRGQHGPRRAQPQSVD